MALDLSADWQVVDNLEAVTLLPRTTGDAFGTPVAVAQALRRAVVRSDAGGQSLLGRAALTWHLWPATFTPTGAVPKVRDVIQDGQGGRWSVLEVHTETLSSRYRCVTVRERA